MFHKQFQLKHPFHYLKFILSIFAWIKTMQNQIPGDQGQHRHHFQQRQEILYSSAEIKISTIITKETFYVIYLYNKH